MLVLFGFLYQDLPWPITLYVRSFVVDSLNFTILEIGVIISDKKQKTSADPDLLPGFQGQVALSVRCSSVPKRKTVRARSFRPGPHTHRLPPFAGDRLV